MPQFTGGPSVRVNANTSVEIKWITDVAWLGKVEVFTDAGGITVPIVVKNAEDAGGNPIIATQQVVVIPVGPAMQANTAYFFKVTAMDPMQFNADIVSPTPLPMAFTGVQAISNVRAAATTNSATIAWQSNVIGFGKSLYGSAAMQSVQDANNITDHALDIPNLTPGTTYSYTVSNKHAIDGDDLAASSGSFTTQQVTQTVVFTEPHAEPRVIAVGGTSTVSVRAKNQGNPVPGVVVTFSIDPSSQGSGTLATTQASTNANGVASVQLTGNSKGPVHVNAASPNATNSPLQTPVIVK